MTSEELIIEAGKLVNPQSINNAEMGGVACILVTDKNNLFKGVCIDTISGMGFLCRTYSNKSNDYAR